MKRLEHEHPFIVLVLLVAVIATLIISTAAIAHGAITQRERSATCAAMGEIWSDVDAECIDAGLHA